jgi:hypothetical protein
MTGISGSGINIPPNYVAELTQIYVANCHVTMGLFSRDMLTYSQARMSKCHAWPITFTKTLLDILVVAALSA